MRKAAASVLLSHPAGMHARPAIKLTQLAKRFVAALRVSASAEGPWTDVKRITKVISIRLPSRTRLFFQAEGLDADAAVDAMVKLVERNFADASPAGARAAAVG